MTRTYNIDKDDPVTIIEQLEEEIEQQAEQITELTRTKSDLLSNIGRLVKSHKQQSEQIENMAKSLGLLKTENQRLKETLQNIYKNSLCEQTVSVAKQALAAQPQGGSDEHIH